MLYKNKDIADALSGYFVESFTREEVTNRADGILNTENINVNSE